MKKGIVGRGADGLLALEAGVVNGVWRINGRQFLKERGEAPDLRAVVELRGEGRVGEAREDCASRRAHSASEGHA